MAEIEKEKLLIVEGIEDGMLFSVMGTSKNQLRPCWLEGVQAYRKNLSLQG